MKRLIIPIMFITVIITAIIPAACEKNASVEPERLYPEADAQGIDGNRLATAIYRLQGVPGMKSVILGRNGMIAVEEYFNYGGIDVPHDVRSVTKSVMGLLIGIAIREGIIQSTDQTVGEFLLNTELTTLDSAKANITIEHLLTMSCGLEWHELEGGDSYSEWINATDPVEWFFNQSFIHTPGEGFNYNTASTHILSVILEQEARSSSLEFARTHLFTPMGIEQSYWTTVAGKERHNNGGAGLQITSRAMFDIGNLMLNQGVWNGEQIVPSEWVNQSVSEKNDTGNIHPYGTHYGYLWWVGQAVGYDLFYAMGWGGQFIVCVPDLDFVVVATCEWSGVPDGSARQHWTDIYTTIMNSIIPTVED